MGEDTWVASASGLNPPLINLIRFTTKDILGSKRLPRATMSNADLARIINSDEVQSVLNPAKDGQTMYLKKRNPLKNIEALDKLNPYAAASRKAEMRCCVERMSKKNDLLSKKREMRKDRKKYKAQGKAFYKNVSEQGSICENGFGV